MPGGICPRCLENPSVSANNTWCHECRRAYDRARRPVKAKPTMEERFWAKVEKEDWERHPGLGPCWMWTGHRSPDGYGMFQTGDRISKSGYRAPTQAHIVSCRLDGKDCPAGHEWDHICRIRPCVNPSHLEAIPHRENVRRGFSIVATYMDERTTCLYGHDLTSPEAWYYRPDHKGRICRLCQLERANGRREDRRSDLRANIPRYEWDYRKANDLVKQQQGA